MTRKLPLDQPRVGFLSLTSRSCIWSGTPPCPFWATTTTSSLLPICWTSPWDSRPSAPSSRLSHTTANRSGGMQGFPLSSRGRCRGGRSEPNQKRIRRDENTEETVTRIYGTYIELRRLMRRNRICQHMQTQEVRYSKRHINKKSVNQCPSYVQILLLGTRSGTCEV